MHSAEELIQLMNNYAPFRGAEVTVTKLTDDFRYCRVELPLTEGNKNYMGTQYGGNLYTIVDPLVMLLLINILGEEYVVWDKSASIEFVTPGIDKVYAEFKLSEEEISEILERTKKHKRFEPEFEIEVKHLNGDVVAKVVKKMWIKKKRNLSYKI